MGWLHKLKRVIISWLSTSTPTRMMMIWMTQTNYRVELVLEFANRHSSAIGSPTSRMVRPDQQQLYEPKVCYVWCKVTISALGVILTASVICLIRKRKIVCTGVFHQAVVADAFEGIVLMGIAAHTHTVLLKVSKFFKECHPAWLEDAQYVWRSSECGEGESSYNKIVHIKINDV